eukprot:m.142269 g.142269  ORF g.142269 m.142269 type:complete len:58 (+) comp11584_c2_seq7:273-446(+)
MRLVTGNLEVSDLLCARVSVATDSPTCMAAWSATPIHIFISSDTVSRPIQSGPLAVQ